MLLVLDMGNTNITIGGFDGETLLFESRIATNTAQMSDEYAVKLLNILRLYHVDELPIDGAIISSVVPPLDHAISKAVTVVTGVVPLFVGPGIKTGLNIRLDNPAQLGADLLVGAVAAVAQYGAPCIIWDLGTATTVSAVDAAGAFRGGAIMPGVGTALHSLSTQASLLPHIRLEAPSHTIGTNTITSMQSGAIYGNSAMLDGMTERILEELGSRDIPVIVTGGLGLEISKHCRCKTIYDKHLLLTGLRLLYEKNR